MTINPAQTFSIETNKTPSRLKQTAGVDDMRRRSQLGIKAKLFLAFFTLAGLTAVASAVAWYVFYDIDRAVRHVTVESVPSIIAALSAAEKSAEIAAAAPALMSIGSQEERVLEGAKLEERARALASLIDNLIASKVPQERTIALSNIERETTAKLKELNASVEKRLRLEAERQAAVRGLSAAHASFLLALEPLIDDSVFNLVTKGEDVTAESIKAITDLVEGDVNRIDQLFTINAEGNLAAGLLTEAAHVSDPALIQPIRERFLAAAATVDRRLRQLPGAPETTHESFLLTLIPMIDDAAFDLVVTTERVITDNRKKLTDFIDVSADVLQLLLTLRAEGNLGVSLLDQTAGTLDVSLLGPLHERFVAAKEHIEQILRQLPPSLDVGQVQKAASAFIDLGKGDDGIFGLRRGELQQIAAAQSALAGSRALAVRLGGEIAGLVASAQTASNAAAIRAAQAIKNGALFMMIITIASIIGAVIVMLYYVAPRIIRPLESITRAMMDLATGDTSVDIPGRERSDELGRMAQALGVFRDTAIEVQKSNLKEIAYMSSTESRVFSRCGPRLQLEPSKPLHTRAGHLQRGDSSHSWHDSLPAWPRSAVNPRSPKGRALCARD